MNQLKKSPFFLTDKQIEWVEHTKNSLTLDEKLAQLFCLIAYSSDEHYLKHLASDLKVGGVMLRTMPEAEVIETVTHLQTHARIPMLLSANLEAGGNGVSQSGTKIGTQMQVAATDNPLNATRLGEVCGKEANALGVNWAFAPIIDIDYNFRNPITNTRTFGSDVARVETYGKHYVEALQKEQVAASIKHFPGDGIDERDQHLVTSVNDLSIKDWDESFGRIYKASIEAGAKTVMVGHIMQPSYTRLFNTEIKDADMLPASLSYELTTKLLKEKLGFNGLVISDSTTMAGMVIPMSRKEAVPKAIQAGCDMFLFTKNVEEDFQYMKEGYESGVITKERLDEALTKILALKASLELPEKQKQNTLVPNATTVKTVVGCKQHREWAKAVADQSITLVKEEANILPISPQKYRRILVHGIETKAGNIGFGAKEGAVTSFVEHLKEKGFKVDVFQPKPGFEGMLEPYEEVINNYDLIIYVANMATKSNQTIVRIEWEEPMGANVPVHFTDVPTIFISLENPYHLIDVPRIRTYINTYGTSDEILDQLIKKLTGLSAFKGISPSDVFCGKWDTRL